jgi:hypothetical protein
MGDITNINSRKWRILLLYFIEITDFSSNKFVFGLIFSKLQP